MENLRDNISSLVLNIQNNRKCMMCGGICSGGICDSCGKTNESFIQFSNRLEELLKSTPNNFFKDDLDLSLTELLSIKDYGINEVNRILDRYDYINKVTSACNIISSGYYDILSGKLKLSDEEYNLLINLSLDNSFINNKIMIDICSKAMVESNLNLRQDDSSKMKMFSKFAEYISKNFVGANKIKINFKDIDIMKSCTGNYALGEMNLSKKILSDEPFKAFSIIFHELTHQLQEIRMHNNKELSFFYLMEIMDNVNLMTIGKDYYNSNNSIISDEIEAYCFQYYYTVNYFQSIGVTVPNEIIQMANSNIKNFYDNIGSEIFQKRNYNGKSLLIREIFSESIYNHPEYFDKYPQLAFCYKKEENHIVVKTLDEIKQDYEDYKNGKLSWNGQPEEIDIMYQNVINTMQYAEELITSMENGTLSTNLELLTEKVASDKPNIKGFNSIFLLTILNILLILSIIIFGTLLS